jgi:predicted N-acyltransferase
VPGLTTTVHAGIDELAAAEWDALAASDPGAASPFVRHAFLTALERSGSAAPRAGWAARHVAVRRGGALVAAVPAWLRSDSDGDFSRDWEWAAAAARARVPWYPKLNVGVPFTPATGRRLLLAPGQDRDAALEAAVRALRGVCEDDGAHGVHVLFAAADEARRWEAAGFALRVDFQYHWRNEGYASPEAFLERFPSKKRTQIRREKAAPARQGIAIRTVRGDELSRDPAGWAKACFALHRASTDKMTWGMRWVNARFYEQVLAGMPDAVEVVEARREGRLIAMAFNLASPTTLYGRYWGCVEEHPFLHFNVALYHSIDECIRRGVQVFEGGAGGEHKLSRGFEPAETWSAHLLLDPRLDRAFRQHADRERDERLGAVARWREDHPRLGG